MNARRLQLGASRLERLSLPARSVFIDKSWVHLGDGPEPFFKYVSLVFLRKRPWFTQIRDMYRRTEFREFWFRSGDRLPFENDTFGFVFSEHFFEHLDPDVALALFRECYRILKIGGVIRTVVPDAVLRTYEPAEPEGYPTNLPSDHSQKHRIRWTSELLSKSVEDCGFRAILIDYCTKQRTHIQIDPKGIRADYNGCVDWPMVSDTSYVMRKPSLIVDAIKER